jgi:putative transposase
VEVGSIIGPNSRTSRSGNEKARWRNSEASKTLQKFASVHASIHNHFNHDRHLHRRDMFKQKRSTAIVEWRELSA